MINYIALTKPRIILGNLVTVITGFFLASQGIVDWILLFGTMVGMVCIIGSACVFNNYIDRDLDRKMERTKKRPLVQGTISESRAITFALALCIFGNGVLYFHTNMLTVLLADLGLFIYVFLYSFWKGDTIYGTAIGSLAGALPPVIGYAAAANQIDFGAVLLFAMLVLWQMPHFFSIAILHRSDYTEAQIPVLPIVKGIFRAQLHMTVYIIGFVIAAALLTYFQYAGLFYLAMTSTVGLLWLALCLKGFYSVNNKQWAKHMLRTSLVMINTICLGIAFENSF